MIYLIYSLGSVTLRNGTAEIVAHNCSAGSLTFVQYCISQVSLGTVLIYTS